MGVTHFIRNNVSFVEQYFWQKGLAWDMAGAQYAVVVDKTLLDIYSMHLYKYTDSGGVYAPIVAFSKILSDINKLRNVSMVFDPTFRYLHLVYVTEFLEYQYLIYGIFDTVDEEWDVEEIVDSGAIVQAPDICLDMDGNPHLVYNKGTTGYYYLAWKMAGNWSYRNYTAYAAERNHCQILCNSNNEICLYLSLKITAPPYGKLFVFPAGMVYWGGGVDMDIVDAVMRVDSINDVHFLGTQGSLQNQKYDYSEGSMDAAAEVVADIYAGGGYALLERWDNENNLPILYAFYVTVTDKDVVYKVNTAGVWGAEVEADATLTAPMVNGCYGAMPPTVDKDYISVKFIDNDGATPFPVEAWHSKEILPGEPAAGGYYTRGSLISGEGMSYGIGEKEWSRIVQFPNAVIAVSPGPSAVESLGMQISGDINPVSIFCTGKKIYEYELLEFSDIGEPIALISEDDGRDFGEREKWKYIDSLVAQFEGGDLVVMFRNEKGDSWYKRLEEADSGEEIFVGFGGKVFSLVMYHISKLDFHLKEFKARVVCDE